MTYFPIGTTITSGPVRMTVAWAELDHAAHDTRTYAQHLRGRVRKAHIGWMFSVVNVHTGRVVSRDDGHRDLTHAFTDAEFATAVARAAWMRGLTKTSLLRDGQKS